MAMVKYYSEHLISDTFHLAAYRSQMIDSLFEPEVGQIVGAKLVSKVPVLV